MHNGSKAKKKLAKKTRQLQVAINDVVTKSSQIFVLEEQVKKKDLYYQMSMQFVMNKRNAVGKEELNIIYEMYYNL